MKSISLQWMSSFMFLACVCVCSSTVATVVQSFAECVAGTKPLCPIRLVPLHTECARHAAD